jgi:putative ABC transport system permease protein
MNILNKVTLQILKKNNVRTIVTIIGVILSAAMITAITTSITSLQNFLLEGTKIADGNWYVKADGISEADADKLSRKEEVEASAKLQYIGYSVLKDGQNQDKPYLFVAGFSKETFEILPIELISGRLPENSGEVVISDHIKTNGGVDIKEGDTLNLDVGKRQAADGVVLWQDNPLQSGEKTDNEVLTATQQKTYKVVGVCKRPNFESNSAPGYSIITISEKNESAVNSLYLRSKDAKEIYTFTENNIRSLSGVGYSYNDELLMFMGVSDNDNFYPILYRLAAILIVLVMFGSISLIYNAFSISVGERTKQFGLLSSVGATRKQLFRSVISEALFVCLIGIPLGIVVGIAGIGATLYFISDLFLSLAPITIDGFHLYIKPITLVITAVLALITVLISALIPARRASRLSVINAIRQSEDVKIKARKVKSSKITYKLFGLEGTLASKNFKRQRRRYRSTVISLFLSVVLFITASAFCNYLSMSVTTVYGDVSFDISYKNNDVKQTDKIKSVFPKLAAAENVTTASYNQMAYGSLNGDYDFSDDFKELLEDKSIGYKPILLCFSVDDAYFKSFAEGLSLNPADYLDSSNPKVLMYSQMNYYYAKENHYNDYKIFNTMPEKLNFKLFENGYTVKDENAPAKNMSLNYTSIDKLPAGADLYKGSGVIVIIPESTAKVLVGDFNAFDTLTLCFKTSDAAKAEASISKILTENTLATSGLYNIINEYKTIRNLIAIVKVFSYGFICLISLISVANVFNTISTNINLRRREFAMLKSVGMTDGGFKKMMNYECILYGVKSLIYGLPVACLLTYLMKASIMQGVDVPFTLPYTSIIISVVSVFLVVFATMLYSMRKLSKENIIEALKCENA